MTHRLATYLFLALTPAALAGAATKEDAKGCTDPPAFTRMPNFRIASCKRQEFASQQMRTAAARVAVEGRFFSARYYLHEGATPPGIEAVIRNYVQAVKAAGGEVLFEERRNATLRLMRGDQELWATVGATQLSFYDLVVIEKGAMTQHVVANAERWMSEIDATGHAAVHGVYFDTGRAVLKPESDAALEQMARVMKERPKLAVYLVGHTDGVGELAYNLKLSADRAQAVASALVSRFQVPAARLTAQGVGPLAPVASNATEEGRAQNRRVEMVAR
jgi:OmpA-OmpF porin, OOP family